MKSDELAGEALKAREYAYARYSRFPVGVALLTTTGKVFLGCNVENLSFGLTMCAERVAVGAAIQAGETSFTRIVIVSASKQPVAPCGACRQVLAEFNPNLRITSINLDGLKQEWSLHSLLPCSQQGILG